MHRALVTLAHRLYLHSSLPQVILVPLPVMQPKHSFSIRLPLMVIQEQRSRPSDIDIGPGSERHRIACVRWSGTPVQLSSVSSFSKRITPGLTLFLTSDGALPVWTSRWTHPATNSNPTFRPCRWNLRSRSVCCIYRSQLQAFGCPRC